MRTTLTLENDLVERIADLAKETRKSFKVVLNETLRRGLKEFAPAEPKFVIKPHAGHLRPGIDNRRFNELVWEPDAEEFERKRDRRRPVR